MNTHLNDGQLRAALDGELNAAESEHLQNCAQCQTRESAIRAQVRQATGPLAFLAPAAQDSDPGRAGAQKALRRFHQKRIQKETNMFKRLFASPALRYAAIAVLLLVGTASFPATRALADQLLSLFRVQQVAVVPIDFTGMQQLTGQGPIGQQMSQLLSTSITITQKPGQPLDAADAAQASQLAGFSVRLPQGKAPSQISVMKASAFSFKIDRAKAQALLNEAGRGDLLLPASVDGQDISVKIPAGVSTSYGTCPAPKDGESDSPFGGGPGSPGRRFADCILFAQIPSPTVSAPPEVNVAQLAQIGLEFTGMTSDEAAAFTNSVDWTSTLVIPIPKNAATYKQVRVDGVTGTLIQRPSDDEPQFSLVWVKNGIIYAIGGLGANTEQAMQMANSLP
jgi:hypothetical protein